MMTCAVPCVCCWGGGRAPTRRRGRPPAKPPHPTPPPPPPRHTPPPPPPTPPRALRAPPAPPRSRTRVPRTDRIHHTGSGDSSGPVPATAVKRRWTRWHPQFEKPFELSTSAATIRSTDGLSLSAEYDRTDNGRACAVICHAHPRMQGTMKSPLLLALR